MTAHCSPRHSPRYGTLWSRAKWAARTLPSIPRWPKPPGTRIPAAPSSRSWRFSFVSASESTQRTFASTPWAHAAWRSASVTLRYASGSSMYLPTSAISTVALGRLDPGDERPPPVEVRLGLRVAQAQLADDEPAQAGLLEHQRDLVDRRERLGRDHRVGRDVGEERDLLPDLVADRVVAAEDDDVGLDADAAQLLDGVLGRLRLQLAGRGEGRQQRDVDVEDVRPADVLAHLADRLEERQALDVADGPADLDDHDVRLAVTGDAADPLLDLVRDVGDDLDGPAEVVATALLGDDGLVDAAGRDVGELGQVLVDEPLVVAQVEVRLGAVVGDEDLAVLVGRSSSRGPR